jgi:hypothetical protein
VLLRSILRPGLRNSWTADSITSSLYHANLSVIATSTDLALPTCHPSPNHSLKFSAYFFRAAKPNAARNVASTSGLCDHSDVRVSYFSQHVLQVASERSSLQSKTGQALWRHPANQTAGDSVADSLLAASRFEAGPNLFPIPSVRNVRPSRSWAASTRKRA